jgi:hypothetical protein
MTYFIKPKPPVFEGADQVRATCPGVATAETTEGSLGID